MAEAERGGATYRLCPRCGRTLPSSSREHYCSDDGARLLGDCPACHAPITSPYARYCTRCGHALTQSSGGE